MKDKFRGIYPITTAIFVTIETLLYAVILTQGGKALITAQYLSILICLLYLLVNIHRSNLIFVGAMACTCGADFFLVLCPAQYRVWGMVCFLGAQMLYGFRLHQSVKSKAMIAIRIVLSVLAIGVTVAVLREKTDPLALISLCYYANLIMNIVMAFAMWKTDKLLPIAFLLFLLCDTVIGLQIGAGAYLPITEGSVLHSIIFVDFPLAWFFYLPSQVLLALCGAGKGKHVS